MDIQYRKNCDCPNATASGPRKVMLAPRDAPGGWVFTVKQVLFACDECDTPWVEVSDVSAVTKGQG